MNRSLAYITVFERDSDSQPGDLIGGFDPDRDSLEATPMSMDQLFDDSSLPPEVAAGMRALKEASLADLNS